MENKTFEHEQLCNSMNISWNKDIKDSMKDEEGSVSTLDILCGIVTNNNKL